MYNKPQQPISQGSDPGRGFVQSCTSCTSGMWEAPQVPNPKTDYEMAPIYRAQDDWPPSFLLSHVRFGT